MKLHRNKEGATAEEKNFFSRAMSKWLDSPMFTHRKIFSMLLPLIMDTLFVFLIGLLTNAMVSTSGKDSFTAVNLVSPLYMMVYAVYNAISAGGTVVVAQFKGKGQAERVNDAAGQLLLATPLSAVAAAALLITFSKPLLGFLFADTGEAVLLKAQQYLIGIAVSMIFLAVYMGAFAVFRGLGETKKCLILTILINVLHFCASYLFIYILKLDIMGTVLSLNLARAVGGVVAVLMLLRSKGEVRVKWRNIFHFDKPILQETFRIGIPFGMENLFMSAGTMLVQIFVAKLGVDFVYINGTCNSILSLLYAAPMAVGALAVTVVGQCVGAGRIDLAKRYGKAMVRLGTALVVLSLAVLLPLMPVILMLFDAPQELQHDIYMLIFIASAMLPLFWSASNNMPYVMRAAGDASFSSYFSLITMWAIRVGLGYVFTIPLGLGLTGLWLCAGIEWAVRCVVFWVRFRSDVWLRHTAHGTIQ